MHLPLPALLAAAFAQDPTDPAGTVQLAPGQVEPVVIDLSHPDHMQLDRIVAIVGERLVFQSDIDLERSLLAHDHSPVPVLGPKAGDVESWLIDAAVIRGLAGQVAVYQPSAADVRVRLDRLRSDFSSPADYEAFLATSGLDEDQLSGRLYRRMVVELYVHRNVGLAAEAAGDDERGYQQRYDAWMEAQRGRVTIRRVPQRDEQ